MQGQAEQVSKSRNKLLATMYKPFSRSLYVPSKNVAIAIWQPCIKITVPNTYALHHARQSADGRKKLILPHSFISGDNHVLWFTLAYVHLECRVGLRVKHMNKKVEQGNRMRARKMSRLCPINWGFQVCLKNCVNQFYIICNLNGTTLDTSNINITFEGKFGTLYWKDDVWRWVSFLLSFPFQDCSVVCLYLAHACTLW